MTEHTAPFGVYVHIPYCKQRCPYCDFNIRVARAPPWQEFEAALIAEIRSRAAAFEQPAAATLYFGGGTPSLAPARLIDNVRRAAVRDAGLLDDAEITAEVDPGTIDAAGLRSLRAAGVNRISLGWQSTDDGLLRRLGRGHTAAQSRATLQDCRSAGFDNVSVDLIFAVPGQSTTDLHRDLEVVCGEGPEHVSIYELSFHRRTLFSRLLEKGELNAVTEALACDMLDEIVERLAEAGYQRYEVSNWRKPGLRRHNQLYWHGAPYLGVGPGSHSFLRQNWRTGWRWEVQRSPHRYIAAWQNVTHPTPPEAEDAAVQWCEKLTARQLLTERLLCGLRLCDGVDLATLELGDRSAEIESAAQQASERGWLERHGSRLVPTHEGLRCADAAALLFA